MLYAYLPLRDFFASVQALEKGEGLSLELINLQHAVPERDYLYGLGLLREAFAQYEASVGIGPEMSKRAMPFFRENSRQLVGPEVGMYILPRWADGAPGFRLWSVGRPLPVGESFPVPPEIRSCFLSG